MWKKSMIFMVTRFCVSVLQGVSWQAGLFSWPFWSHYDWIATQKARLGWTGVFGHGTVYHISLRASDGL